MAMDRDAREPIHGLRAAAGDQYLIPGQIHISPFQASDPATGGIVTRSGGYVVMRCVDLDQVLGKNIRLKVGDHLIQWAAMDGSAAIACDLYVTRGDPAGHYPNLGATLMKYYVEDRDPVI